MAAKEPADIRMERMLEGHVTQPVRRQLEQLLQQIASYYIRLAGDLNNPLPPSQRDRFLRWLVDALLEIEPNTEPRLQQAAAMATAFGVDTASQALPGVQIPDIQPSDRLLGALYGTDEKARGDILEAAAYAQALQPSTWQDAINVSAKANRALRRVAAAARWTANHGLNSGVEAVANELDVRRVWVPERDACLSCLAYAGLVVGPGEWYPGGLTFGDRPVSDEPVAAPPLHPNCRCRQQLWLGSRDGVGPVELPEALRREALRTVLRGASGHDSTPAQLRAADRLLIEGIVGLPKSVVERARRDVARRQFSRRDQTVRTGTMGP